MRAIDTEVVISGASNSLDRLADGIAVHVEYSDVDAPGFHFHPSPTRRW